MIVKQELPKKHRSLTRLLLVSIILASASGCASNGVKESLQSGFSTVGDKVSGGIQAIKNKRAQKSKQKKKIGTSPGDIALVKRFPLDQVPHTLMRKPVANGVLTSGHGYRLSPTGIPLPRKHKGVDYGADTGTSIFAAGNGTIEKLYVSSSYGKYIRIQHQNGFSTAYAHMDSFAEGLKTGMEVARGQVIGTVGSTGKSSGPHLHFELLYGSRFIDPLFKYDPDTATTTQANSTGDSS